MTVHENRERLDTVLLADAFARSLSVEVVDWSGGTATAVATPGSEHCNFLGGVHGAFLIAAADAALAVASNSWGRLAVAVSIDMHYYTAVKPGQKLVASATEVSRGRNLAHYSLDVRHHDNLITSGTAVVFRTNTWQFGADAWSDGWRARY